MRTSLQVRINRARLEHVARRHMQASARRAGARALASRYQVCLLSEDGRESGLHREVADYLADVDDMTVMVRCRG